tara:strand:- start:478 stop:972 length:495 start_codon:yes stop_codon:yes gene_type:complete
VNLLVQNNYLYSDLGRFTCAIGRAGLTTNKIEGDHKTPVGEFKFKKIYYRKDKLGEMIFQIPFAIIAENDGWCDDPKSKLYNQHVQFPFDSSAEKLFRDDDLYDLLCVINHNTDPIIPGKGSAIFLHISKPNFEGTEGCVAIEKENIIELAKKIDVTTKLIIKD